MKISKLSILNKWAHTIIMQRPIPTVLKDHVVLGTEPKIPTWKTCTQAFWAASLVRQIGYILKLNQEVQDSLCDMQGVLTLRPNISMWSAHLLGASSQEHSSAHCSAQWKWNLQTGLEKMPTNEQDASRSKSNKVNKLKSMYGDNQIVVNISHYLP